MKFKKAALKPKLRLNKLTQSKKEEIALDIWAREGKQLKIIAHNHEISDTTVHVILHEYFEWILVQKKYVEK